MKVKKQKQMKLIGNTIRKSASLLSSWLYRNHKSLHEQQMWKKLAWNFIWIWTIGKCWMQRCTEWGFHENRVVLWPTDCGFPRPGILHPTENSALLAKLGGKGSLTHIQNSMIYGKKPVFLVMLPDCSEYISHVVPKTAQRSLGTLREKSVFKISLVFPKCVTVKQYLASFSKLWALFNKCNSKNSIVTSSLNSGSFYCQQSVVTGRKNI